MSGLDVVRSLAGWRAYCKATKGQAYYRDRIEEAPDEAIAVVGCIGLCVGIILAAVCLGIH